MAKKCAAKTLSGKRCKRNPKKGCTVCGLHSKKRKRKQKRQKRGKKSKSKKIRRRRNSSELGNGTELMNDTQPGDYPCTCDDHTDADYPCTCDDHPASAYRRNCFLSRDEEPTLRRRHFLRNYRKNPFWEDAKAAARVATERGKELAIRAGRAGSKFAFGLGRRGMELFGRREAEPLPVPLPPPSSEPVSAYRRRNPDWEIIDPDTHSHVGYVVAETMKDALELAALKWGGEPEDYVADYDIM